MTPGGESREGARRLQAETHAIGPRVATMKEVPRGIERSSTRRAREPEVRARVGRLKKQSQELGKRLVAVERGCHGP